MKVIPISRPAKVKLELVRSAAKWIGLQKKRINIYVVGKSSLTDQTIPYVEIKKTEQVFGCLVHTRPLEIWVVANLPPALLLGVFFHEVVHWERWKRGGSMNHRGVDRRALSLTEKFLWGEGVPKGF